MVGRAEIAKARIWLALISSESAAVSRDLPIPGSPEISTTRPSPTFARRQRRNNTSTSSSRPTSGVVPERNASNRLTSPLSPKTRQTRCGSPKPARCCGPRSSRSNSSPICCRVLAAITRLAGDATLVAAPQDLASRRQPIALAPSPRRSDRRRLPARSQCRRGLGV